MTHWGNVGSTFFPNNTLTHCTYCPTAAPQLTLCGNNDFKLNTLLSKSRTILLSVPEETIIMKNKYLDFNGDARPVERSPASYTETDLFQFKLNLRDKHSPGEFIFWCELHLLFIVIHIKANPAKTNLNEHWMGHKDLWRVKQLIKSNLWSFPDWNLPLP